MSKQYIQQSVFDRLNQEAAHHLPDRHITDIRTARSAVLRDVENLLNTRRNIVSPPACYQHLNNSVYVYGLEDFVSKNPKSADVRKALAACIKETITKFEPRLVHVSVEFNPELGNEHNLCFKVKATHNADPVREPIFFDTWFYVNRGEYKVLNDKR
jgi:type VI secretion system lysozyme-like protein